MNPDKTKATTATNGNDIKEASSVHTEAHSAKKVTGTPMS